MIQRLTEMMKRPEGDDLEGRPRQAGFTLIELLVVIIILGILAAVVVFAVGGITDRGQKAALQTDNKTLRTAEEAFYVKNKFYASEQQLVDGGFLAELSSSHNVQLSGPPGAPTGYTIVCAPGGPCGPPASPVNGGILVFGQTGNTLTILNPAVTSDGSVHGNSEDMFNGLLSWDSANPGQVNPDLATAWTIDNNSTNVRCAVGPCTTATFTLNTNVKWHDTTDVTADDVKFSFEKALLPFHSRTGASLNSGLGVTGSGKPCGQPGANPVSPVPPAPACFSIPSNSIVVNNPDSVTFNFSSVVPALGKSLNVTEAPIIPKAVFEPCANAGTLGSTATSGGTACAPSNAPVGSGPFKFSSVSATQVKTLKNPLYTQFKAGLPYLDGITKVKLGTTADVVGTALENGTIDIGGLQGADIGRLKSNPAIVESALSRSGGGTNCIQTLSMNTESRLRNTENGVFTPPPVVAPYASTPDSDEPATPDDISHLAGQGTAVTSNAPPHRVLGDEKVREAMYRAFDRSAVLTNALFGVGRVADSPFHSLSPGYVPQTLPSLNRPTADTLLDQAGWAGPRDSGGFRTALNHPQEFDPILDRRIADTAQLKVHLIYASSNPQLDAVMALFKADMKLVGINVIVQASDNSGVLAPKVFLARDFDMVSISYCNQDDPFAGIRRQWHSSQVIQGTSFTNSAGYKNATMDGYWDSAALQSTDAGRAGFYASIQNQGVNGSVGDPTAPKLPMIWMYESVNIRGTRSTCAGFNHNNTGLFAEGAYCKK